MQTAGQDTITGFGVLEQGLEKSLFLIAQRPDDNNLSG
jgi:hypothetical protein